jgi:AraC-like DNA-binding protein
MNEQLLGDAVVGTVPRLGPETVSVDSLQFFQELVTKLGGDAEMLLAPFKLEAATLQAAGAVIEYRTLLAVMDAAAKQLACPDFGLRLAVMQGGNRAIGPVGVVMKNSRTLGQAIGYCAKNIHAYSPATRVRFEPDRANHRLLLRLEIMLEKAPDKCQAVEHALMLATLNIRELTGGSSRVRRVLFSHAPQLSMQVYRQYFNCEVVFNEKMDGLVLAEDDLVALVVNPDSRVYEMATAFIDSRFPQIELSFRTRVRSLIEQYISSRDCTNEKVAADFCLHPRTLQRRLRSEGVSFEDLKDEVRRDLALRYIQNTELPLKKVAERLGYAETSVLSRSCFRWFSTNPRELRSRVRGESSRNVVECSSGLD